MSANTVEMYRRGQVAQKAVRQLAYLVQDTGYIAPEDHSRMRAQLTLMENVLREARAALEGGGK